MIEVMITIVFLGVAIMSLGASSALALRQLQRSRIEVATWAAVQRQTDSLRLVGYDNVQSGSATVGGYPMTWSVSGTDPKMVVLEVRTPVRGTVRRDTTVLYLPKPAAP